MDAETTAGGGGKRTPLGAVPAFAGGVQRVADETFAWIQPNGGLGESNAGLIVGDDESALIDTLWDEHLTRRMLDAFAPMREGAPITTLVNTHGDGDHWYGNGLLGGAEVVATEAAARQMEAEPPTMLTRLLPLAGIAAHVARLPLLPSRDRMRGLAAFGSALDSYEFNDLQPKLPTRCFNGEHSLLVGGRRIELIEVGPAHTPGDAIVWLEDARVVFSGDIVFNGVTPIMWAGPASSWIGALERIAGLGPERIVPGHGPVCDSGVLADLIGYWEYLLRNVPAGAVNGAEQLSEELVRSAEYRSAPWGAWSFPERTLVNVTMIARERNGETGGIGVPKRLALLAAMGALRERLTAAGIG